MANINITRDSQIKQAIKQTQKIGKRTSYSITGFKGLELRVRLNQYSEPTADFRHRYTHPITGKRPYMTLGQYPAISLSDARDMHRKNMALIAKGIDPIENKENEKLKEITERKNTLNNFINEWRIIQKSKNLSASTLNNHEKALKPIESQLGHMRVTDITPSMVIKFINDIQKTKTYTGLTVKTVLKSILQIAKAHRVIEYNPASDLQGTLKKHRVKHRPSISNDISAFAKLLNDIEHLDDKTQLYNKNILKLLSLTFVRIGDVCAMKWTDINLDAKQWHLEPQKAVNRSDMMTSLVIPLAPQSIAILNDMRALNGDKEYVFYNGKRKKDKYHHQQQVNKVLNSELMNDGKGYKGIHTPHGFRATAKTMLTERLGYDELITELALGHRMLNAYGTAYNRMTGLEQRTEMMTTWANYLDDLKAGKIDNVIYTDFRDKKVKQG